MERCFHRLLLQTGTFQEHKSHYKAGQRAAAGEGSHDVRGLPAHADHGAVYPPQQPLHHQPDVLTSGALGMQAGESETVLDVECSTESSLVGGHHCPGRAQLLLEGAKKEMQTLRALDPSTVGKHLVQSQQRTTSSSLTSSCWHS